MQENKQSQRNDESLQHQEIVESEIQNIEQEHQEKQKEHFETQDKNQEQYEQIFKFGEEQNELQKRDQDTGQKEEQLQEQKKNNKKPQVQMLQHESEQQKEVWQEKTKEVLEKTITIDQEIIVQRNQQQQLVQDLQTRGKKQKINQQQQQLQQIENSGKQQLNQQYQLKQSKQQNQEHQQQQYQTKPFSKAQEDQNQQVGLSSPTGVTSSSARGPSVNNSRRTSVDNSGSEFFNIPTHVIRGSETDNDIASLSDKLKEIELNSALSGNDGSNFSIPNKMHPDQQFKLNNQGSFEKYETIPSGMINSSSLADLEKKLSLLTNSNVGVVQVNQAVTTDAKDVHQKLPISVEIPGEISENPRKMSRFRVSIVSETQPKLTISESVSAPVSQKVSQTGSIQIQSSIEDHTQHEQQNEIQPKIMLTEFQKSSATFELVPHHIQQVTKRKKTIVSQLQQDIAIQQVRRVQQSSLQQPYLQPLLTSLYIDMTNVNQSPQQFNLSSQNSIPNTPSQEYITLVNEQNLQAQHLYSSPKEQQQKVDDIMSKQIQTHSQQHQEKEPIIENVGYDTNKYTAENPNNIPVRIAPEEQLSLAATNPSMLPSVIQSDIKHNLDTARNHLCGIRLETNVRQRLLLLLQRQHIEEDELRLKHFVELEKFQKTLGASSYSNENNEGYMIQLIPPVSQHQPQTPSLESHAEQGSVVNSTQTKSSSQYQQQQMQSHLNCFLETDLIAQQHQMMFFRKIPQSSYTVYGHQQLLQTSSTPSLLSTFPPLGSMQNLPIPNNNFISGIPSVQKQYSSSLNVGHNYGVGKNSSSTILPSSRASKMLNDHQFCQNPHQMNNN